MFGYITSLFRDPRGTLIFFLLAFPGRLFAISAHEFAHAWVADKCGDPTARNLGRLTLNPMKHLDPLGLVMMLLLGFGWAKPVPVNPRNYRNFRRDDLLVSLAGIAMNLILFLLSGLIVCLISVRMQLRGGGRLLGYVYQMFEYFMITNISLAVFNLIPIPPLDGWHLLNDTVLKGRLRLNPNAFRVIQLLLVAACLTGMLSKGLSTVNRAVYDAVANLFLLPLGGV